jgi:hypothetical protein
MDHLRESQHRKRVLLLVTPLPDVAETNMERSVEHITPKPSGGQRETQSLTVVGAAFDEIAKRD